MVLKGKGKGIQLQFITPAVIKLGASFAYMSHLSQPAANGTWTHPLRPMVHVYFRNLNLNDINQNYRYHSRVRLAHNQHRPNWHRSVLPDQKLYCSDTRNGNLGPMKREREGDNKN